jgi:osmotically-inducible protein OsmY
MTNTTATPQVADVQRRVHEAVASIATEPDERISVCVKGTCAVLKGTVRSWAEHEAAERTALSIPGVTTVDNQLALLVKAKLAAS